MVVAATVTIVQGAFIAQYMARHEWYATPSTLTSCVPEGVKRRSTSTPRVAATITTPSSMFRKVVDGVSQDRKLRINAAVVASTATAYPMAAKLKQLGGGGRALERHAH